MLTKEHTDMIANPLPLRDKQEITRTHETVKVNYLKKLVDAMGGNATRAAQKLGLTGSTINTNLRDGFCRTSTEYAAAYFYERDYAPKSGTKVAIITCDEDTMTYIGSVMNRSGGSLSVIDVKGKK